MKQKYFINCFILFTLACHSNTPDLFSFKLTASNKSIFDFSILKNNKASVFVFLAPDCPLSQNYTLTLNSLHEQFLSDSIVFYGIIPGDGYMKKECDNFINKYKINYPVLSDPELKLTNFLKATKTPEVFAVDSQGKILYKGAIDNWAADFGQHRSNVTEHYLMNALVSILLNKEVSIKETAATGCFIENKTE